MKLLENLLLASLLISSVGAWKSGTKCCRVHGRLAVCDKQQQRTPLCCPKERMNETEVWVWTWVKDGKSWQNGVYVNDTGHFDFYNCLDKDEQVYLTVTSRCYIRPRLENRPSWKFWCTENSGAPFWDPSKTGWMFYAVAPKVNECEEEESLELSHRPVPALSRLNHCCRIRGRLPVCSWAEQKTPLCCPPKRMNEVVIKVGDYMTDGNMQHGVKPNISGHFNFYTCAVQSLSSGHVSLAVESRCYSARRVSVIMDRPKCAKDAITDLGEVDGKVFYSNHHDKIPKENLNRAYYCDHPTVIPL